MPTIIRAADLQPRPWPNGLGTTRTITEQDRSEAGLGWMLGVADLAGPVAFSHLPGLDRSFTVIEGEGCTLELEGCGELPCPPWRPSGFPGDVPAHYRPWGGPARAFNVMVARGIYDATVSVRALAPSHAARVEAAAIFLAEGTLDVGGARLDAGDTLLHPGEVTLRAAGKAAVFLCVEIRRR